MVDTRGRFTHFYAKLGDKEIPIYQPGTIMFENAVLENSQLAVHHGGSQQNGGILGNGCALFLSRVTAELAQCYEQKITAKKLPKEQFDIFSFN